MISEQNVLLWLLLTPLVACSIIMLALVLERLVFLLRHRRVRPETTRDFDRLLAEGQTGQAADRVGADRPFFVAALDCLEQHADMPRSLRDEQVSLQLDQDVQRLKRGLSALPLIATLAPMFGLAGTVTGMIVAFRAMEQHVGPVEPAVVAGGLWQAMITTGLGLVIAAPSVLFHGVFVSAARRRLNEARLILNRLSIAIERTSGRQ
jgi:biopolymer transport protein ExbB